MGIVMLNREELNTLVSKAISQGKLHHIPQGRKTFTSTEIWLKELGVSLIPSTDPKSPRILFTDDRRKRTYMIDHEGKITFIRNRVDLIK